MTRIVLDPQEMHAMADTLADVEREFAWISSRLRGFEMPYVPYSSGPVVSQGVEDAAGALFRITTDMFRVKQELRARANLLLIGDRVDDAEWIARLVGGPLSLGEIYRKITGGISKALRSHPSKAVRSASAGLLPKWGRATKWASKMSVKAAGKFLVFLDWWMTFDEHYEKGASKAEAITRATTEVGAGVITTAGLGSVCAGSAAAGIITGGTSLLVCGGAAIAAGIAATGLMEEINDLIYNQPKPIPMAPGPLPGDPGYEGFDAGDVPDGTVLG